MAQRRAAFPKSEMNLSEPCKAEILTCHPCLGREEPRSFVQSFLERAFFDNIPSIRQFALCNPLWSAFQKICRRLASGQRMNRESNGTFDDDSTVAVKVPFFCLVDAWGFCELISRFVSESQAF